MASIRGKLFKKSYFRVKKGLAKRHTREFGTHRVKVEIRTHFLACLAELSCAESSANIGDCGGRVVENLLKFLLGLNDLGVHIYNIIV